MNFTNTDCVKEEVEINQILGYWKVRDQVNCQVNDQVWNQVNDQVNWKVYGQINLIKYKISQEINK